MQAANTLGTSIRTGEVKAVLNEKLALTSKGLPRGVYAPASIVRESLFSDVTRPLTLLFSSLGTITLNMFLFQKGILVLKAKNRGRLDPDFGRDDAAVMSTFGAVTAIFYGILLKQRPITTLSLTAFTSMMSLLVLNYGTRDIDESAYNSFKNRVFQASVVTGSSFLMNLAMVLLFQRRIG